MEVTIKKGELFIRHKLKSKETYKISESSSFKTISIFKKPILVKGFSNTTKDNYFIPVFDYDNTCLEVVEEDFISLQEKYSLTPAYLFKTSENKVNGELIGSYHAICLSKFRFIDVQTIINESRCDSKYKTMNNRNPFKSWILRISNKNKKDRPKFIGVIGKMDNFSMNNISEAHLSLLKKLYRIPKIKYKNKDGLKSVKIHTYETAG